jgi:hypothetical protein
VGGGGGGGGASDLTGEAEKKDNNDLALIKMLMIFPWPS